jgi:hypothetical protein
VDEALLFTGLEQLGSVVGVKPSYFLAPRELEGCLDCILSRLRGRGMSAQPVGELIVEDNGILHSESVFADFVACDQSVSGDAVTELPRDKAAFSRTRSRFSLPGFSGGV